MNAEVVYMFALDIAQEADLVKIEKLLSGSAELHKIGRLKDTPRHFPVFQPLSIQVEGVRGEGPSGPVELSASVKLFAIGAMSLKLRLPVVVDKFSDLLPYRKLKFKDGTDLEHRAMELALKVFESVKPGLDTPVQEMPTPEVFTVFCISSPMVGGSDGEPGMDSETWMRKKARDVAALLVGETDPSRLSSQEVEDITRCWYSYYCRDLTVIDWDTALLIDIPEDYNDTLYVMEMANLQLEELKVYDMYLDQVLDKAYDEVERASKLKYWFSRQKMVRDLREVRMDLSKVTDEITNITKFFGEWHLARIYMGCATRFHLSEWENAVNQKLHALDGIYSILQQDTFNFAMFLLEAAIVALFIIDLIIIIFLGM
ncbi:MAG TPA: hypothetical protein DCZ94_08520 [Lentisphaeria bacterium]|nr:hypothetical protein [Lentisphaeria bacterium]